MLQVRVDERIADHLAVAPIGHGHQQPLARDPCLGGRTRDLRGDGVNFRDFVEAPQARHLFYEIRFDADIEAIRRLAHAPAAGHGLDPFADGADDGVHLVVRNRRAE